MDWKFETAVDHMPVEKEKIRVKRLHPEAKLPAFQTKGSVGADLYSVMDIDILPGNVRIVSLGFAVSIPPGLEIQIRPRSGLAANYGITVLNSPGTVDSDYRGEMKVILINLSDSIFRISKGDRIAQAVVAYVPSIIYEEVEELDDTARGEKGFGSTGKD